MRLETLEAMDLPRQTSRNGCVAVAAAMGVMALGGRTTTAQLDAVMRRKPHSLPDVEGMIRLDCHLMDKGYRIHEVMTFALPNPLDYDDAASFRKAHCQAVGLKDAPWINRATFDSHVAAARLLLPYERKGRLTRSVAPMTTATFRRHLGPRSAIIGSEDEGHHQFTLFSHYRGERIEDPNGEVAYFSASSVKASELDRYYFKELPRVIYKRYGFTVLSR